MRHRRRNVLVAVLAFVAAISIAFLGVAPMSDDDASLLGIATSEAVDAIRGGADPDAAIGRVFRSYEPSFSAADYNLLAEAGRDAIESGDLRSEYVDDVDGTDVSSAAFVGFVAIVEAVADEAAISRADT